MRNFLLLIFSLVISLFFLEMVSTVYINSKKEKVDTYLPEKARKLYEKYYQNLHHLRGFMPYKGVTPTWDYKAKASNVMYTTIRDFQKEGEDILIQGDSWAAQFIQNRDSLEILREIASKNTLGLAVAGTSSYSFSPMEVQLRILKSDFDIIPTHLITVVDHTDIGDELCRYINRIELNNSGHPIRVKPESYLSREVYSMEYFFRENMTIFSSKFNTIKLFELGKLQLWKKIFKEKRKCKWEKIARPLLEGLSQTEKLFFKGRMRSYIDSAFANGTLNTLTFVIHPHIQHLEKIYTLYLDEIMKEVISENAHQKNIFLIDFMNLLSDVYLKNGYNS